MKLFKRTLSATCMSESYRLASLKDPTNLNLWTKVFRSRSTEPTTLWCPLGDVSLRAELTGNMAERIRRA